MKMKNKKNIKNKARRSSSNSQRISEDVEFHHRKVYLFMQALKRDYERLIPLYNACIQIEQERERRNTEEINRLKKIYNEMQVEKTNIKRTRWCRYCESEATYLSSMGINFYCSKECEQKQNDFVSAMAINIFDA